MSYEEKVFVIFDKLNFDKLDSIDTTIVQSPSVTIVEQYISNIITKWAKTNDTNKDKLRALWDYASKDVMGE